jgi:peptide/nickel transport system substrate-binding protein
MKKFSIVLIAIALTALIVLGVTMIGAQDSQIPTPRSIPGTVTNDRPIKYEKGNYGGTVIFPDYGGDPKTYNMTQANETSSTGLIYRFLISLLDYDEDKGEWRIFPGDLRKGKTGPGYTIEKGKDGQQIITFYLRKDIFWTNGSPMTADDWVWYWNWIETNGDIYTAGYPGTWIELPNGEEEQIFAKKIDRLTFQLIYPRVLGEPELNAGFTPMPKHILEPIFESEGANGVAQLWGVDTPVDELIGNGPWILEKYEQNSTTVLKRNSRYFKKDEWQNRLPYLDQLINKITSDLNASLLLFQNKEVDLINFQNKDFKQMVENAEREDYTVWNGGPTTGFEFVSFNQNPNSSNLKGSPKLEWFTSKEFRTACSLLIDREAIISQVYEGLAEPDVTYFHKASPYYDRNTTFNPEYNVKKALRILEGIGIRDRNGDGIAEDSKGNIIKFEILTNSGNTIRERLVSIIANEWRTYGMDVTATPIDFNVLVGKLMDSFDWDCVMIGLTGGQFPLTGENVYPSSGNLHLWHPKQAEPATKWEEAVDKLFKMAKYEPDFEKRKKYTNEMFSIMYEEMPFIPLVRKYSFLAIYNKFGNVKWDVWAGIGDSNSVRLFTK